MERMQYLGQTIYKWQVGSSSFLALPEKGARLMNWNEALGDKSMRNIIYWPEVENLETIGSVRGGNPILFPFSGRTYDQGVSCQWRADDGMSRPMPMHGLAKQGDFRITRLDETGFSSRFVPDKPAMAAYPYNYEFVVSYHFHEHRIFVELQLTNLSDKTIPWSAGHHFYFTLPWSVGLTRQDYCLETTATKHYLRNECGGWMPFNRIGRRESMANPDLIDLAHTDLRENDISITEIPTGNRLNIRSGMTNSSTSELAVITWTHDEKSPYYCIEPWMGPPNAAETKSGLHYVAPWQTQKFNVEVNLQ